MAEKRMFSQYVIETDAFYTLPVAAQALYLHVCMTADDDGFCTRLRMIASDVGAAADDVQALVDAGYLLCFDGGVCAARHWCVNNTIRKDLHRKSIFGRELSTLEKDGTGAYVRVPAGGAQPAPREETHPAQPYIEEPDAAPTETEPRANAVPDGDMQEPPQEDCGRESDPFDDRYLREQPQDDAARRKIPLANGEDWVADDASVSRWSEAYPALDVPNELMRMAAWCEANPTRRKTRAGIRHFVVNWLSLQQERRTGGGEAPRSRKNRDDPSDDLTELDRELLAML